MHPSINQAHPEAMNPHHPAFAILEQGVAQGAFTAWSCANTRGAMSCFFADERPAAFAPGHGAAALPLPTHPIFDLASLTKPLFLNLFLRLHLTDPALCNTPLLALLEKRTEIGEFLISQLAAKHSQLSLLDFLNHATGAKPWFWMGKGLWLHKDFPQSDRAETRYGDSHSASAVHYASQLITSKAMLDLRTQKSPQLYSDLNYFLLARILENLPAPIAVTNWNHALHSLNEILGTSFFHASLSRIMKTTAVPFYPYVVSHNRDSHWEDKFSESFGPVHDTNANILASLGKSEGLVSGHAGLFGNIVDVCKAVQKMSLLQPQCMNSWEKNSNPLADKPRFVCGLDTASSEASAAGLKQWPLPHGEQILGHLGYTGTSFWMNAREEHPDFQVLLTNRTAHRTSLGSVKIPRLLCTTDFVSGESKYFLVNKKSDHKEIQEEEYLATIETSHGYASILWNRDRFEKPANILQIRREVGKSLWR
jgi:hypothetical protein